MKLSLAAYRLPRSIGKDGCYSRLLVAVLGITAGSGSATRELKLLLIDIIREIDTRWPMVVITLFVDDLNLEAIHASKRAAAVMVAAATDHAVVHFQSVLDLAMSTTK